MIPRKCDFCGHTLMIWDLKEVAFQTGVATLARFICDDCHKEGRHLQPPTGTASKLPTSDPLAFSEPEDGSEERYARRRRKVPWVSHTFWWVVHNCVAHPLIGVAPAGPLFQFHDWTSRRMHGR